MEEIGLQDEQTTGKISKKVSFKENNLQDIELDRKFEKKVTFKEDLAQAIESPQSESKSYVSWESVRNYVRERGKTVSDALRRIGLDDGGPPTPIQFHNAVKNQADECEDEGPHRPIKGRITIFTRSGCVDCATVRKILREKGLRFVEINLDVFPLREAELRECAGPSARVPQVFLNDKLLGGIVVLNSLLNSGEFDDRVLAYLAEKCPPNAPEAPVYGVDDERENAKYDGLIEYVHVLRHKLPIQDRFSRFRRYTNCFTGADVVEVLIHELDCGRKKAIEIGKKIAVKHFFHHINDENDFEDGNHLYRFMEHDPTVATKCLNFSAFTNDEEPKPAVVVAESLRKIMQAIRDVYVSEDGEHVNYLEIQSSEEFRRYCNMIQDLQRINISELTESQRLAFFLNIFNSLVIHAIIRRGYPNGMLERRQFFNDSQYVIGGYPYSLTQIHNGILRGNRRPPYALGKSLKPDDKRIQFSFPKLNNTIHFALCNGSRSGPSLRFFSADAVDAQLRDATREFLRKDGIRIDAEKNTIYLNQFFNWFDVDFGETQMLSWIMSFLEEPKLSSLADLAQKSQIIDVEYTSYDWSLNV